MNSNNMKWKKIPHSELGVWDERLLKTNASIFQYPYWNEALRNTLIKPKYYCCFENEVQNAYICILSVGLPFLRVGIVRRGPVNLLDDTSVTATALKNLIKFVRRKGYIFLRFSFSDQSSDMRKKLQGFVTVRTMDAFPYYKDFDKELVVKQVVSDSEMLMGFQQIARQEIKGAKKLNYHIKITVTEEDFKRCWILFEKLSERKGFIYRSLDSYIKMIQLARTNDCVRLYSAYYDQRLVEAILIIRDRDNSYYLSGALDIDALPNKKASPSCLLQWKAMRDFYYKGTKYHNLGTRSGTVYQFKRKFRPKEIENSDSLTVVINNKWFVTWEIIVLRIFNSHMKKALNLIRRRL